MSWKHSVCPPLSAAALAALSVLVLTLAPPPAAAQQVIASSTSEVGNFTRTEWTVQAGPAPIDRFQMVRIRKSSSGTSPRASIFFLPPLGSSFSFYEQGDESGGVGTSIAGFFAERGYDVFGYVPRYVGVPAGTCEAGVVDCSVMGDWNLQSQLDDVAFIRQRIEALHPGGPIVAGGTSLGAILAVAVANDAPADYDGVIVWEGMLTSDDPAVLALNDGYCDAAEAQLAAGLVFDGVGTNVFKQVAKASELEPGGVTVNPLFPPFLTNHQALVLSVAVPTPGPVTMPTPGYVLMAGSFAEDRLFFASEPRLYENVGHFNSYAPTALVRDISCSLAGRETAYVSNLGSFDGAVLAIGGGRGFGAYMGDQLDRFTAADVTFLLEPAFGHIDHFMIPRHRQYVERPIFTWAEEVFGSP